MLIIFTPAMSSVFVDVVCSCGCHSFFLWMSFVHSYVDVIHSFLWMPSVHSSTRIDVLDSTGVT